ncbi:hypothetical protein GCM10027169_00340 [Gordonia jinhuaensis]|uniref:Helix-turn-helix domain-containing protein n=1 Tax=Gordonia jinhuaensis TaxID=1517702 RepID=A0A916WN59_9ACTN|nr:helix-turn-helix domain-containing protein [Gordonia jinhuaensis]GGB18327.1 hypothetical protein GCM10011489_03000 [Gordonia jinhuaensis]
MATTPADVIVSEPVRAVTSALPDDMGLSEKVRTETGFGIKRWQKLLRNAEIPSIWIGKHRYVRRSDVQAYITKQFDLQATSA